MSAALHWGGVAARHDCLPPGRPRIGRHRALAVLRHARAQARCSCRSTVAALEQQRDFTVDRGELFIEYQYGARLHYRASGVRGSAVLLVHGFGVGSFQFKRLQACAC